jgi:hypothetical protein
MHRLMFGSNFGTEVWNGHCRLSIIHAHLTAEHSRNERPQEKRSCLATEVPKKHVREKGACLGNARQMRMSSEKSLDMVFSILRGNSRVVAWQMGLSPYVPRDSHLQYTCFQPHHVVIHLEIPPLPPVIAPLYRPNYNE